MGKWTISGFADEITLDLPGQLEALRRLGIGHLEIRGVDGKNISDCSLEETRRIKQQLDESGIAISAIGSPVGKSPIDQAFEPQLQKLEHLLEQAQILNTRYVRVFSFFIPQSQAPENFRTQVLERMTAMVRLAEQHGVMLLILMQQGVYGDTAARCLDLFEACPGLRCTFDPGNFVLCGEDVMQAYQLLRGHLEYMHVKDARRPDGWVQTAGSGDGDLPALLSRLHADGFSGFFSIDPHVGELAGYARGQQLPADFTQEKRYAQFSRALESFLTLITETEVLV